MCLELHLGNYQAVSGTWLKSSEVVLCLLVFSASMRSCVTWQAERLQQYRDRIAQESGATAASLHAHSNLEQIVDQFSQDEEAQQDNSARCVMSLGANRNAGDACCIGRFSGQMNKAGLNTRPC